MALRTYNNTLHVDIAYTLPATLRLMEELSNINHGNGGNQLPPALLTLYKDLSKGYNEGQVRIEREQWERKAKGKCYKPEPRQKGPIPY